jgi:hypothetical protein
MWTEAALMTVGLQNALLFPTTRTRDQVAQRAWQVWFTSTAKSNAFITSPWKLQLSFLPATLMVSPLSRTSSAASLSSVSDDGTNPTTIRRRSRKRFSNVQLMMLEDLFHQKSHPSRGERDAVAKLGDM